MSFHATTVSVGINGFGRFGLHLLRYWIINHKQARFVINYINDSFFSIDQVEEVLRTDKYVSLSDCVAVDGHTLVITFDNGDTHRIQYTHTEAEVIPWLDSVGLFLECSGKYASRSAASQFLRSKTSHVLISATAENPDSILVYGYNHEAYKPSDQIISYGSCTINAYVPLAAKIDELFGVTESDVSVIHNVPEYQLVNFNTLQRRTCTLEFVAPTLLPFITNDNFTVTYTLVPYSGVSIIDYRFRLSARPGGNPVSALRDAIDSGPLKSLFAMMTTDAGPENYKFTPYSAVIIEPSIKLIGNNLYLQAYFDNENSANRYFDTANYISERIGDAVH